MSWTRSQGAEGFQWLLIGAICLGFAFQDQVPILDL